jgi:precorrin-6B methylase 1
VIPLPDSRYAHWQQQPDDDLDYCPEPDQRVVVLETLSQIEERVRRRTIEEDACLDLEP